jgi:hypothetical protein
MPQEREEVSGARPLEHEAVARDLLTPLWRGIPSDYKKKYARNIWEQFENNIRSAAYTARASEFLSKITQRLGVTFSGDEARQVSSIVGGGHDRELLKMLREDTTYLALLVRADNEERKERYNKTKEGV